MKISLYIYRKRYVFCKIIRKRNFINKAYIDRLRKIIVFISTLLYVSL